MANIITTMALGVMGVGMLCLTLVFLVCVGTLLMILWCELEYIWENIKQIKLNNIVNDAVVFCLSVLFITGVLYSAGILTNLLLGAVNG